MPPFPAIPAVPEEQTTSGEATLNYEDITQDGRLLLTSPYLTCSRVLWAKLFSDSPFIRALQHQGIAPVFSRLFIEGASGPFGMAAPLTLRGGYELASAGREGSVERILLNMWGEVQGKRARMGGPKPAGAGEVVSAGRFFTEQVLTRPTAPPEERKVRRLSIPGFPEVPEARYPLWDIAAITELPPGAEPLEPALSPDSAPTVFGLCHTDSNQHVNSIVYLRMFEEAALRRLSALGVRGGLARECEVGYRKPFFAGDQARIVLQAFTLEGGRSGAVGVFLAENKRAPEDVARPHCAVRMLFES